MSDNKSKMAPQDAARINVNEDYELQYWTKELSVSEDQLRELVKRHGVSASAVRAALGK
jgi:hypothetical protein